MMSTGDDNEQTRPQRRGYRYRPVDAPELDARDEMLTGARAKDEAAEDDADLDEEFDDEADDADLNGDGDDEDEDDDEPPSEFWPAAELLKGATITDAELELSYSASIYVNTPVAELRLWLRLPDGTVRLVQIDEPQSVWLYRQAQEASGRDFEEYPDHRFELPSSDLRVLRTRHRRQLIDRQAALHEELVALGEELEELERDANEDAAATADWPGTRWP
jgi:hypothetical protein